MHIFTTRLKVLLKTKANIFWAFIFPLLLGTFFQISFGGLSYDSPPQVIDLYVASESLDDSLFTNEFLKLLEEIEITENENLFIINISFKEDQLINKLDDKTIEGYILIDGNNEKINYHIYQNGINQTIVKSIFDQYLQYYQIIKANSSDPVKLNQILNDLNLQLNLIIDEQINTYSAGNSMVIYFYALIAMVCMYSALWGFNLIKDIQADQSDLAFRVSVAPTKKSKLILIYLLAAFIISFSGNMILLLYLKFILGVDLGNFLLVILVVLLGTIAGMSFGGFIGVAFKGNPDVKEGIMSGVILLLSAMSGLMNQYVKFFINSKVPILGYINPANLITDALYSLYYYSDLSKYYFNILLLSIFSVIMITIVVLKVRREKYDSI
ncbi:MAG: ABC transporter permease [Acholeplasmataceae bacterium]|nr:ABC transporter permease [Acholeplasmataceae bacterium]